MEITEIQYNVNGVNYIIRKAVDSDAEQLSMLRVTIDGETEYLDREKGEAYIDVPAFREIIRRDTEKSNNLFLVAEMQGELVGFARCQGYDLHRFSYKVEFGVCVLKRYWRIGIGTNLLEGAIQWADRNEIRKITLTVVETNEKAIALYRKYGFEIEGVLREDRLHSDGKYYNTIVMGRLRRMN